MYCFERHRLRSLRMGEKTIIEHASMLHLLPLTLSLPLPPLSCSLFEQLNCKMRDILGLWESDVAVTKHNNIKK